MCENEADLPPPPSSNSLALRVKPLALMSASDASVFSFASSPMSAVSLSSQVSPAALVEYQQRLQLYDYAAQAAVRFRLSHAAFAAGGPAAYGLGGHPALSGADGGPSFVSLSPFSRYDPRSRFMHEEPKPQHSYIGLIAMAILSVADKKMVLSDIYQHILDHYPYFRNRGPGWRNSIRHNLSLNDCFVKAGRSANGKGHYWAIHPANVDDFTKGDFRRRKAQRKVRKHMGLSVPEDEDSQSPTPIPRGGHTSHFDQSGTASASPMQHVPMHGHGHGPQLCANLASLQEMCLPLGSFKSSLLHKSDLHKLHPLTSSTARDLVTAYHCGNTASSRPLATKRQFDVESLLAPDCDSTVADKTSTLHSHSHPFSTSSSSGHVHRARFSDPTATSNLHNLQQQQQRRSTSPLSSSSTKGDQGGSNCSSPSMSSSGLVSPQPNYDSTCISASKAPGSAPAPSPAPGLGHHSTGPSLPPNLSFPSLASWQAAQIQSLQNLHQINATLANSGANLRNSVASHHGLSAWAAMSSFANSPQALSHAQAAATLFACSPIAPNNYMHGMASPPRSFANQK